MFAHFRSTARFDEMIWQYFVLPNYAYNYNDMLSIMHSQMPDGLAEYLETRYPDLFSVYRSNCRIKSSETLVFIGGFVNQGAWDKF